MQSSSPIYRATLLISVFVIACSGHLWAAESARITSVQVSPDLKQTFIRCDGPVGKHSAFVIQKPCRLVLDLDSTGLGKIPGRIDVGRGPMNEIRLGYANSRARVVMDFGDNPVPSFRIDRQPNGLIVSFGVKTGAWQPRQVVKPAQLPSKPVQAKAAAPNPASPPISGSAVSVKTAGIKDNLVFVELASKKDPKRTCRLVVDLDVEQLQVRQATLSDSQGNTKRFDVALSKSGDETPAPPTMASLGPRKTAGPAAEPSSEAHPKFQWGEQASEKNQEPTAKLNCVGPIRVERFEPQRIRPKGAAKEG